MITFDKRGDVVFGSTGRREYCFGRDFTPNDNDSVLYGSDGGISDLTPAERAEIAAYMIDRWRTWLAESDQMFGTKD